MKYLSITTTLLMAFASTTLMATEVPSDPYRIEVYKNRITETTARIKFRENSTNELGFHIYNNGELLETLDAHEGTGKIRHELQGLNVGTTYNLTVKAFNSEGESGASNLVTLTTQGSGEEAAGLPEAPLRLELYHTRVTETTARIKFRDYATDELGFHIYNDGVLIKTIDAHEGTGKVRVELDGLGDEDNPCGELTNITVKAFNDLGESEATNRLVFLTENISNSCRSNVSNISGTDLYELTVEEETGMVDYNTNITFLYINSNGKFMPTSISSYHFDNGRYDYGSLKADAIGDTLYINLDQSGDAWEYYLEDSYDISDLSNVRLLSSESNCEHDDPNGDCFI